MKIAIIIDDPVIKSKLVKSTAVLGWEIDFFQDSKDFGLVKLSQYDVIFADLSLKPLNGRQILQSIWDKTDADLYLMGEGSFSENDINNDHIMGLINKDDVNDLIDKINFVKVKKRLQDSASAIITDF
jgi:DNA-binding response OmpR family regulator